MKFTVLSLQIFFKIIKPFLKSSSVSGEVTDVYKRQAFYHHLRMEMDEYRRLKRSLRVLKSYTDYEEDLYEEAV